MSFPRAKIQRFNDVTNSVPSPTKYDPKLNDKVIGGCILKGQETKSSTFSDTASASSSKSNHTPIFRTPQLPRRHNCLGIEKGSLSAFKSISLKSDDIEFLNNEGEIEELKALRVECSNKSETINDLEKHIQDLRTQLSNHEKAKEKLETYIVELETVKSNLECIKSNNDNYEQQISELQLRVQEMQLEREELEKSKENLLMKLEELEKRNSKLEDSNLDYERKLISFEGTIEHLEMENNNKDKLIAEIRQKEENNKMNYQVSLECLKGKISTLENEIKELDLNKSKNEATIFALETQISNLNVIVEKLKNEMCEDQSLLKELKSHNEELDTSCKNKQNIILGLEMELESRIRNAQELKQKNESLMKKLDEMKVAWEEEKLTFENNLFEINERTETKIEELNAKIEEQKTITENIQKDFETKKLSLIKSHMEEVLQLQNEYESKLLAQMQDNTEKINNFQCQLDEKENCLKQANLKYVKASSEWEKKFLESESNFSNLINNLQSEHLETIEETKKSYIKKLRILENNSCKSIDQKNKEIDLLTIQYKEILQEVNILLSDLEKKDEEVNSFQEINKNLNSRLKLMLEEIKLLNKENEEHISKLDKMTTKYNQEFSKNEQLSCKLGERDTEIVHLKDDLSRKTKDWKNLLEELGKSNERCEKLQVSKCSLESTIVELQDKSNKLLKELDERKTVHKEEVKTLKQELVDAKNQCRKFEIIMGNTGKSLEALRQRLIESENEVSKLGEENSVIKKELMETIKMKTEYQDEVEILKETKLDLETAMDESLSANKNLVQKCTNLELISKDLELKICNLGKTNEELEKEKQKNIEIMNELIKNQELQLIEAERASLSQIEQISETVSEKLEFFMKFSTEKVCKLTTEIKNLRSENEKYKSSLKSKTEEFDNLFTDYEILKTTVDISVKEIENLKKRCEDQFTELKEKEMLIQNLMYKKEELEESLADKSKEYFRVVEECERLRMELEEKESELKRLYTITNDLSDQVNNLEAEILNLEAKLNDKTVKLRKLEKEMSALENRIKEKTEELVTCQEEKDMCIQEVESLKKEKEVMIANTNLLKKKLADTEELSESHLNDKQLAEEKCRKQKIELEELNLAKGNLQSEVLLLKKEIEDLKGKETSLEEIENRKNYYKNNCLRLDKLCQELTEENTSLKNDFNEIHSVLQVKEKKIEELEKRSSDLESLIGPFREQLERYETERLLIENDREQLRKQHLEQAAELGHRNHKQKIQHVVNLKNTLLQTRKENEKLTLEIKNLKKKMQKLQEELGHDPKRLFIGGKRPSATPFKGKENSSMLSPAAGFYPPITVKQEPMSPSSPLRNRNQ